MRIALVSLSFVVVTTGCLFNRPNPRVSKISVDVGSDTRDTKLDYDDSGHPTKVEEDLGDGDEDTLELKWDNNLLVKLTRKQSFGDTTQKTETELEYEGDRLVKFTIEGEDGDGDGELTYDDRGRVEKIEASSKNDETDVKSEITEEFEYDDAGNLEKLTLESVQTVAGDRQEPGKQTIEFSYEDGKLDQVDVDFASNSSGTIEFSYDDDGRVEEADNTDESEFDGETVRSESTTKFEYDDDTGLIVKRTTEPEEGDDQETEYEYDDGEAAGIDATPIGISLFGIFDAKGNVRGAPDWKAFAPRLLGASW